MVTLSIVGLVWAIVGIVFVWMIVHYGISQGKQRDTAKEFEDLSERPDREEDPLDSDPDRHRRVS
jgi:hypothetical protein